MTAQRFSLEIGRRSSIQTTSPTPYSLPSSCAWYFFERRMVFFMVACVKHLSTRTTTVLSGLSLTTPPWSIRFGISTSYSFVFVFALARAFGLAAALGLADFVFLAGAASVLCAGSGAPARFCAAIV